MERHEASLNGGSREEWFSLKVRVAVAVAVIRTRPVGMSGREHAEALCGELRRRDEGWKEKAQRLQQEVLRLRQEALMVRVNTRSGPAAADVEDKMEDGSQDLFGPGSVACGSDSEPGTPDFLLLDGPEPTVIFPEPPPLPPSGHRGGCHGDMLLPHVCFLHSLCALHRVDGAGGGLEALWFGPDGDGGSVLVDTVSQLLDSVVAACRDPPSLGPPDLVLRACRVAARAMDLLCSRRLPPEDFRRRVEAALRELSGMLLNGRQSHVAAGRLVDCLLELGSSIMSKSFLIGHILSDISTLTDQLWQAVQVPDGSALDSFPLDRHQNSGHLFGVLEELLHRSQVSCRAGLGAELGAEQTDFLRRLEQRVFVLSDEFPLFSVRLWRVRGLLTSGDGSGPTGGRRPGSRKFSAPHGD